MDLYMLAVRNTPYIFSNIPDYVLGIKQKLNGNER